MYHEASSATLGSLREMHMTISSTSDVRLRAVTNDDLPIFFEQQRHPDANQMAAFPARDWDAFTAHWTKIRADENVTIKTVLVAENVAGNIVCWERDGKRLVGYWIGKNFWGQGVATRALAEFVGVVKSRPLYAHVAKQNIASIRVLEKCGFTICDEEAKALDAPDDGVEEFVFKLSKRPDSIRMVIPMLVCRDGASEIDFCKTAFGAVELARRSAPDGTGRVDQIAHGRFVLRPPGNEDIHWFRRSLRRDTITV
jgi:RimJ/RimL family protein N-acetyltransferase